MEYGLIGEKLGHSYSKDIHNLIGEYKYELKEIPIDEIDSFMKSRNFKAINVTIPYKQTVIPYLDVIDDAAKSIGAVNTIVNKNGKLYGYNTDFYGMKSLIEKTGLCINDKNILILGTGGTSKTAASLVKSYGAASVKKVSRKPSSEDAISYEEALLKTETQIIINTTPCGMFPNPNATPISLENFPNLEGVIDSIYNPNCTDFVLDAKKRGKKAEGGLYMLVMQAIKAAELFFDKPIDSEKANEIFNIILSRKENIVLIGMPSCGKTTIGKFISQLLKRPFIDLDSMIVNREKREITEIFATDGEDYFRTIESRAIQEISEKTGCVISTGGGAVLNPMNVNNLRRNGKIFFIDRPLEQLLITIDRPIANSPDKLRKIYEIRYPIYKYSADFIVDNLESTSGAGFNNIALKIIKLAGVQNDIDEGNPLFSQLQMEK